MATMSIKGGDKLRAKLAEVAKRVSGKHTLRVGFLEGSRYPGQTDVTAAETAFWLNYGTKTAPPRPFFTNMINEKSDSWGDLLAHLIIENGATVDDALNIVGELIEDQLRDAIFSLDSPALSPITLMLRKMRIGDRDRPVTVGMIAEAARRVAAGESSSPASEKVGVYSGHMSNSISHDLGDE